MTRINIINPSELTDQNRVAEDRELFMVGSSLQRSLKSPNWDVNNIPDKFTLNKGHVMFFYDKGEYLSKRYDALREEMINRGMKPDDTRVFKRDQWPDGLYNDWMPTVEDQNIVRKRIEERISQKPNWYRLTTNENK